MPVKTRNKYSVLLSKLSRAPKLMILIICLLSWLGILMMYSAAGGSIKPWAIRQIIHFLIFFPVMMIIATVNIKYLYKISYIGYAISLLLLLIVELTGHTAMGATRWINLGFMKLQPSEPIKIFLVFALARYFHNKDYKSIGKISVLIPPILLILVPFALVLKQPDLGTAMILLAIGGMIFFVAGVRMWKFLIVIVTVIAALPLAWNHLHDYQKNRVLMFMDPESDPLGAGYNIIQSKIAIGSGGFFGKGIMQGSQSQLSFLPEKQTDFIFTMLSEELGFTGSCFVILCDSLLIFYGFIISLNCKNFFSKVLAAGVTYTFFLHAFINMAMVMGLLPVVGVPLPLLSYGGTMMMTMLIGFGLILNVHINSNKPLHIG